LEQKLDHRILSYINEIINLLYASQTTTVKFYRPSDGSKYTSFIEKDHIISDSEFKEYLLNIGKPQGYKMKITNIMNKFIKCWIQSALPYCPVFCTAYKNNKQVLSIYDTRRIIIIIPKITNSFEVNSILDEYMDVS